MRPIDEIANKINNGNDVYTLSYTELIAPIIKSI